MAIILNEIILYLNFTLKFVKHLCFRYSAVYRPFLHEFKKKATLFNVVHFVKKTFIFINPFKNS